MTAFLSKISGTFDGLFGIFFGTQGISFGNQSYDLGITKKARIAGDGAIAVSTNLPALGAKVDGFVGVDRYIPVLEGRSTPRPQEVLRRGGGAPQADRPLAARCPTATCSRTSRRSTSSSSAWRSRASAGARTP